ncbi:hypothetical protein OBBRIDRAFT_7642 [Obba rivulosa]|uniref:WD40 repeat-like protein n=1 Tax=Obba rivulosa TaxID=1052685 RepID=A0A8E2J7H2_9APHY|nr:hypothetical protein OBBRIDRAFT_7642 [Obba rivulosa]
MISVVYFHRADMSLHGNWHVAADSDEHYIADLTWGTGPSENLLFASTASSDENDHRGHHKAFDFAKMQPCLTFDLKVVGEKLTTDTKGERLAIVAREPDCHLLHQYDVRRRRQRPTSSIRIDASGMLGDAGKPTETNRIVYSPDGLHLALAFANNTAHVYDSRYLRSEPLHFLEHEGEEKENTYGIVEAQWTEEVGLVTGGADGCVRLWDVRRSSEDLRNGRVIAQRDNDIGHFSLGDTAKGEHTLVRGMLWACYYV